MYALAPLLLVLSLAAAPQPSVAPLEVVVDERIELLAIVARLAGFQQFDTRTLPQHAAAIDAYFSRHRDHAAVVEARRLRDTRDFGFDAVMHLAVHLTPFPELEPKRPFEHGYIERITAAEARSFVSLLAAFAADTNARRFFDDRRQVFDVAVRRMRAVVETELDAAWFAAFFGRSRPTRLIVAVALNNGQVAYGTRYLAPDGTREFYAVMNALQLDEDGLPVLNAAYVPTIVHEFNHSYVNPVVERHLDEIRAAAGEIMEQFDDEMKRLGYRESRTLVSESLVRAAVARYKRAHLGETAARAELARQATLGFVWIHELYDLLGRYESQRERYSTFESFFPEVVRYYNGLPERLPAVLAAYEARRPRVVEMTPVVGAVDVDPSTTTLVFRFDRPMRYSWAVIPGAERTAYPDVSRMTWDDTKTVFTMRVKLKPNSTYEFSLNSQSASGFFSEDGVPLRPVSVKFTTGAAR